MLLVKTCKDLSYYSMIIFNDHCTVRFTCPRVTCHCQVVMFCCDSQSV